MHLALRNVLLVLALAGCPAAPVSPPTRPIDGPPPNEPLPLQHAAFDADASAEGFYGRRTASEAGLSAANLDSLLRQADATESDALIIIKDERTVAERYFGRARGPIELMSVTKSIVGLAIGMLIDDGKIAGLDAPLSTWFPDWKDGLKASVTLRHVLTHTSGLAQAPGSAVTMQQPDGLAYVTALPIVGKPGTAFTYSNEATQLLSGIIATAAGKPVDEYLAERMFAPMGITEFTWEKDGAGNRRASYGLSLSARDLARIGMLMLDAGSWNDKQLVSADWVLAATAPFGDLNPGYGLLWWLRYAKPKLRVDTAVLTREGLETATPLADLGPFASEAALWMELGKRLSEPERAAIAALVERGVPVVKPQPGERIGFYGDGWLGQLLVIYPGRRLVAVRQYRAKHAGDEQENREHNFRSLLPLLEAL